MHSTQLIPTLPFDNPVLVFALMLLIVLVSPLFLNKIRIPHIVGFIVAGAIVGPHGAGLLQIDESIKLFSTVGLLYIMFLAGMEMNITDFKRNSIQSLGFGLYTFVIPVVLGVLLGLWVFRFPFLTSLLLAGMFSTQTLVTYPIISKLGLSRQRSVVMVVGGTMVTDTLAMVLLTVTSGLAQGTIDQAFWIRLLSFTLLFVILVLFGYPILGRWFLKKYDDAILQFVFLLVLMFIAAWMAQLAGLEAIIGAFLAGLAFSPLVPHTSSLMNRIGFVGNSLFIPFFLIGTGMLINLKVMFLSPRTIVIAIAMTLTATLTKYLAARLTKFTFSLSNTEGSLIFGLSNAHAAATLAIVSIGYSTFVGYTPEGNPIRLFDEHILNGTIFLILASCTIASFVTQKAGRQLALTAEDSARELPDYDKDARIMVPVANPDNVNELIQLASVLQPKKRSSLFGINVIMSDPGDHVAEKKARELLELTRHAAASNDQKILTKVRYDQNPINGIVNAAREFEIDDLIMGQHIRKGVADTFLGSLNRQVLDKSNATIYIYRFSQPFGTIPRFIVWVPQNGENEPGFYHWLSRVFNLSVNAGRKLVFMGTAETLAKISQLADRMQIMIETIPLNHIRDIGIINKVLQPNDGLILVMAKTGTLSFSRQMLVIPSFLEKFCGTLTYLLIYPFQYRFNEYDAIDYKNEIAFSALGEEIDKVAGWSGWKWTKKKKT